MAAERKTAGYKTVTAPEAVFKAAADRTFFHPDQRRLLNPLLGFSNAAKFSFFIKSEAVRVDCSVTDERTAWCHQQRTDAVLSAV